MAQWIDLEGFGKRRQIWQTASLVRDAGRRVKEVLAWLPTDTESLWVNQEPFTIKPEETVELLFGRPAPGRPPDAIDIQIAAIALCCGAALATRSATDFQHTGITLINPWTD